MEGLASAVRTVGESSGGTPLGEARDSGYDQSPDSSAQSTPDRVLYGELVVLGTNGRLPLAMRNRLRSRYQLFRRQKANGVTPVLEEPSTQAELTDTSVHTLTISRSKSFEVMNFTEDKSVDMFQIGRSLSKGIDFCVIDMLPGCEQQQDAIEAIRKHCLVSRFACRILISREPPHQACLFAAAFNDHKDVFLGENALSWKRGCLRDGMTTNGVMVLQPSGLWHEVSVLGDMFRPRSNRGSRTRGERAWDMTNLLTDGSLIDLGGATLMFRTAEGLKHSPTQAMIEAMQHAINADHPQCAIGHSTLIFPTRYHRQPLITVAESSSGQPSTQRRGNVQAPWGYLTCGHVVGHHDWGHVAPIHHNPEARICPICRTEGPFVLLRFGVESAFYVKAEMPLHAFRPCGHVTSKSTAEYWADVLIPRGLSILQPVCPFCAVPLTSEDGSPYHVPLIFPQPS